MIIFIFISPLLAMFGISFPSKSVMKIEQKEAKRRFHNISFDTKNLYPNKKEPVPKTGDVVFRYDN